MVGEFQHTLYLGRHQLHTEGPTIQDITSAQHWVNHPHKRRIKREGVLEHEGEQDVVLALPLLERHQVGSQRGALGSARPHLGVDLLSKGRRVVRFTHGNHAVLGELRIEILEACTAASRIRHMHNITASFGFSTLVL